MINDMMVSATASLHHPACQRPTWNDTGGIAMTAQPLLARDNEDRWRAGTVPFYGSFGLNRRSRAHHRPARSGWLWPGCAGCWQTPTGTAPAIRSGWTS
ncbi:MAG: hypothetical protein ACRDRX_13380 [Pseudonocardiaceae bacterium]